MHKFTRTMPTAQHHVRRTTSVYAIHILFRATDPRLVSLFELVHEFSSSRFMHNTDCAGSLGVCLHVYVCVRAFSAISLINMKSKSRAISLLVVKNHRKAISESKSIIEMVDKCIRSFINFITPPHIWIAYRDGTISWRVKRQSHIHITQNRAQKNTSLFLSRARSVVRAFTSKQTHMHGSCWLRSVCICLHEIKRDNSMCPKLNQTLGSTTKARKSNGDQTISPSRVQ